LSTSTPRGTSPERIMSALRRLVQALRTSASAAERESGLSVAQLFVLHELGREPGQSLGDLVGRTLARQSTVSEVVNGLVRRGLATRRASADDKRRAVFRLSAAGTAVLEQAPVPVQVRLIEGLTRMPAASRNALARSLEEWLAAAGIDDAPTAMFLEGR
jgi:DNA-binding MarR family transcriptional regulator